MNLPSDKHLKIYVVASLLFATIFVIGSAFYDLYNPGSEIAKQYANVATILLVSTIAFSLPLWYKKIKAIESWKEQMDNMDISIRNKVIWNAVKPLVTTLVIAAILYFLVVWAIQYFNLIPLDILEKYKAYYTYTPMNLSNINLSEYPNTTIIP